MDDLRIMIKQVHALELEQEKNLVTICAQQVILDKLNKIVAEMRELEPMANELGLTIKVSGYDLDELGYDLDELSIYLEEMSEE